MSKPTPDNLKEVYECLIECILQGRTIDDILPFFSPDILFYGTAEHEKFFNIKDLQSFLVKQNKEAAQFTIHFERSGLLFEKSFADGRGRILVEEFSVTIEEVNHTLQMRVSLTFDKINDSWICLLIHASTPDSNIDQTESFPVEGLRKRNKELEELIATRTEELRLSLENLKTTQSQLIQSEKMAALGELTAGIAHEIQNPLNFVNNFSEVNQELISDLKSEIQKGNIEEVNSLANDIESNEEKINHHGKRADAIVKGMLQHSRSSSEKKELTDINALCDEYLRLSYHGLRAKDKSFNAKYEFHPDSNLPKVNVVPQDIGRVVLNLINNAFYAVSEKQKAESAKPGSSFEPTVIVSTHYSLSPGEGQGEALITVKDNGPGIPDSIKEKIFQPFFTTKPTGQGTGLGLSLSYDIVKAHGGELKVDTSEGEGSIFTVHLYMDKLTA
jgi:signal transduction histidine kinase